MLAGQPYLLLALVLALQIKHFVGDGPLQTRTMVEYKRVYGHPAGFSHAAIHLAGTAIVLWIFALPWWFVAVFATAEGVVHYHIDFAKGRLGKERGWTIDQAAFWWAYLADQGLHHIVYLAIAAAAVALV